MKGLDEHELLSSLPQQFDALAVVLNHHASEDLVTFAFGFDFEVSCSFLQFFHSKILSLHSILEIQFSALLKRFFTVVCISLDELEELLGLGLIIEQNVFNDLKSKDFLLEVSLVFQELLFFWRDLPCDHSLSTPLLLVGGLPILKLLDTHLELLPLSSRASCSFFEESGLCVYDEGQVLLCKQILACNIDSIA